MLEGWTLVVVYGMGFVDVDYLISDVDGIGQRRGPFQSLVGKRSQAMHFNKNLSR